MISSTRGAMASSRFGRMTFTTALFDFIGFYFKDVSDRLRDPHFFELRPFPWKHFFPTSLQPAADFDAEVLGSRRDVCERRGILIEVAVIEGLEHLPLHESVKHTDITGPAGPIVYGAAGAHVENIVVAVAVWVVALAVDAAVFFFGQAGGVEAVRGGKAVLAGHAEHLSATLPEIIYE